MMKLFIVAIVIIILLSIALSLIYSDYYIEKFTIEEDAAKRLEERKKEDEATKIQMDARYTNAPIIDIQSRPLTTILTPIENTQTDAIAALVSPTTTPTTTPTTPTPTTTIPPITRNNIVDFLAVISAYKPWGVYYAGNFFDNKLIELLGRTDRDAISTGIINSSTSAGFGANGTVKAISGNISSYIEWTANSIPDKFTICSITRYTGINYNKRILTARNATAANDWIHGHKGGKRGVVYYTDYKTNSSPDLNLTGNNTDWVVTCAKNDNITPENVIINGNPSGINSGGQGGLKLSINKLDDTSIIAEQSDFALSYIIIWDTNLTNTALKIVSDALMNYLNTGEDLLFDTNNLSVDDKIKVIDTKSNFLKDELNEMTQRNNLLITSSLSTSSTSSTSGNAGNAGNIASSTMSNADRQVLYSRINNLENTIRGQTVGSLIPTNNVINLNLQSDTTDTTCTDIGAIMPEPTELSFTNNFDDIQLNPSNTDQRPYIWCKKCNANDNNNISSSKCIAYDVCKTNYAKNNKVDNKATFTTISEIDKNIYDNCINAFDNFPKYLQTNTDSSLT